LYPIGRPQNRSILDSLVGKQFNVKTATRRYVEKLCGITSFEPPIEPQPEPQDELIPVTRSLLEAAIEEINVWKVGNGGDDQVVLNLEATIRAHDEPQRAAMELGPSKPNDVDPNLCGDEGCGLPRPHVCISNLEHDDSEPEPPALELDIVQREHYVYDNRAVTLTFNRKPTAREILDLSEIIRLSLKARSIKAMQREPAPTQIASTLSVKHPLNNYVSIRERAAALPIEAILGRLIDKQLIHAANLEDFKRRVHIDVAAHLGNQQHTLAMTDQLVLAKTGNDLESHWDNYQHKLS
jgi:hypothetical protein